MPGDENSAPAKSTRRDNNNNKKKEMVRSQLLSFDTNAINSQKKKNLTRFSFLTLRFF